MSLQISEQDREQIVAQFVQQISHIATLPEVTLRIIELVEDPSSTAQDLHNVISNDPALGSRILKVVNSAFYGLPGQIGSINRAIVLLGLNAVKNIAIAASLAKLYRGGQLCPGFSARDLWTHSIASAACAKLVADTIKLGLPDEAFLAGLIHDIGIMVEMQGDRQKLIEVVNALALDDDGVPVRNMLEQEERVFGANHQDFGRGLCEKWKFPKSFSFVTGAHHTPLQLSEQNRTLACVVYVADRVAASQDAGFRLDITDTSVDPDVLDALKMSEAQLDSVREDLPGRIEAVDQLLS